jgi:hypothetical protein
MLLHIGVTALRPHSHRPIDMQRDPFILVTFPEHRISILAKNKLCGQQRNSSDIYNIPTNFNVISVTLQLIKSPICACQVGSQNSKATSLLRLHSSRAGGLPVLFDRPSCSESSNCSHSTDEFMRWPPPMLSIDRTIPMSCP